MAWPINHFPTDVFAVIFRLLVLAVVLTAACEGKKSNEGPQLTAAQTASQAGLEYLDQNQLAEAENEFTRLIELAPDEVIGYANLGIVYLRQGKLNDAELYLNKALDLDRENVMVRLNLFDVYEQMDQQEKAVSQLKKVLEYDPENLFALYKMSEKSQLDNASSSMTALSEYLLKIIEVAPTNIVPRIYLIEYLLENDEYDKAIEQFEDIRSKFERLPEDTEELLNQAYDFLRNSQPEKAYSAAVMFHNQLKLTNWYQADVRALKGSEDSRIGIPVISFSQKMIGHGGEEDNLVYQNIKFTDVADNAALTSVNNNPSSLDRDFGSVVVVNDLDNDGDLDLLLGLDDSMVERNLYLYTNELGRFQEVLDQSGIDDIQEIRNASFSDFNNDGFLDLLLISNGSLKLYQNVNQLQYEDISESSGLSEVADALCALFFDSDHDGDLDLFVGASGPDRLFQNNGDGSFTDISQQAGIGTTGGPTFDAVMGDFDDDGDVDFFVVNGQGNKLYFNNRMGNYEDVTSSSGLSHTDASRSVSSGDYNNDGFLDFLISDRSGQYKLYQNQGKEGFVEDQSFQEIKNIDALKPHDHKFFDFDNDGFLDVIIVGDPATKEGRGAILLRNDQGHSFEDVSWILPDTLKAVKSLSIGDYNEDHDLDVFVSYANGGIGLLRNDGGNMNHQLKIQLVGLREGSGKNNYYGVGSKVEVRVGPMYQMRTITSQSEYFGLGKYQRADILRIRWTNGVPQNIFSPHSDQDLIEQQKLKGSCPFLYTWNGEQFVFVKDIMWRSALGMPLGIMTSDHSMAYAFPDASREYLMIPGEMLKTQDNRYNLKITGELWETIYLDEVILYAVDHPQDIDFRLDEKFVPPPFPGLRLYPLKDKYLPLSVTDGQNALLDKVREKDHDYISNFERSRYQGITGLRDLIIDLGKGIPTDSLYLFLNGWIFPSDASINVAVSQSPEITVILPYLQVLNERGQWETVIENIGFPLGKNKTMVTNLSKVFKTDDRKIRIRTSMQIYWDHIFYAYINEPFKGTITPLVLDRANLQYRGFSSEFRKGGRHGPHWFDYYQKTTEPKWMDLEGFYTRYGEITPLLDRADDQYVIYNAGDEVSISFTTGGLPDLPDGWERDFVIYSVGWVKDGDLNTAYGQTVTPLPFHGMSSYPYPANEEYPYQRNSTYIREYNTRAVNADQFRDLLKTPNKSIH